MNEKFTLWELLNSSKMEFFDLTKKLKIYTISSASRADRLMADSEEYFVDEIPYRLLTKEVFTTYSLSNVILVFK